MTKNLPTSIAHRCTTILNENAFSSSPFTPTLEMDNKKKHRTWRDLPFISLIVNKQTVVMCAISVPTHLPFILHRFQCYKIIILSK